MKEFTAPENIKVVKLPSYAPENEETARKWVPVMKVSILTL